MEESDRIIISSAEGLAWLSVQVNGLNGVSAESFSGKTIVLDGDIDLAGKLWTPIGISRDKQFKGNFDGQGHTISGLTINADAGEEYVGLFGQVFYATGLNGNDADHPGFIRDVILTDVKITTGNLKSSSYVGALIGESLAGYSVISGCTASGQITCQNAVSNLYVGGLIGYINALDSGENITQHIENCIANVDIQGAAFYVGGLAGQLGSNGAIVQCGATGNIVVTGPYVDYGSGAGGFLGVLEQMNGPTQIRNCYATGNVSVKSADTSYAGGFLGSADYYGSQAAPFEMESCMSSGSVSLGSVENDSAMKVGGGFAGLLLGRGTTKNCYATGNVEVADGGYSIGGGFVGWMQGADGDISISDCYEAGNVTAANGETQSRAFGFSGNTAQDSSLNRCYALGGQMKAEGSAPLVNSFLSTSANVTVENCGYLKDMDLTGQLTGGGQTLILNAMSNEQIKELFQTLADSNPAWKLGNNGYPILTQVREDVQQTDQLDYLYPSVTFDAMNGSQPVVQSVKNGTVSRPEDPVRDGYLFEGWYTSADGGVTLADSPFDFNTPVTDDFSLYAKWTAQYVIQVVASPADGGTVAGGGTYADGEDVMVTATPADGYRFVRWTENGTEMGTDPMYRFAATAARTLMAEFEPVPEAERYQITVSSNSVEGGTVTGGGTYIAGVVATVTAIPNHGFRFIHWTEGGTEVSTSAGYSFTVSGNRVLMAEFEAAGNDNPDTPDPDTPTPDNPNPDTPSPDTPTPDNPNPDHPTPDRPSTDNPQNPDRPDSGNNGGTLPPVDPIIVPDNNGNRKPGNNDGSRPGDNSGIGSGNENNSENNQGNTSGTSGNQSNTTGNEHITDQTEGAQKLDRTPNTGV